MSGLTSEERGGWARLDSMLVYLWSTTGSRRGTAGRQSQIDYGKREARTAVEAIVAARLADAEARAEAAEAAIDRMRKRHPRGDEEAGPLAPGLWCPTCGQERTENGYGGCPERQALRGDSS